MNNTISTFIQNAWQHQSKWLILLRPLSWLYRAGFLLQKKQQSAHAYRAPLPVLIVGNITVGGSGKTPLIISLVKFLQQNGVRVGVISRGYGGVVGRTAYAALVKSDSQPNQVGDEPLLIVQSTGVAMAVAAKRQHAIELLLQHEPLDLIISDDGLQHFALARDIEWVVVDSQRGFGNQRLLPEGFLREPLSRLNQVTVIEHNKNPSSELNMYLAPGAPFNLNSCRDINFDHHQTFAAIVGIGFPARFFQTLDEVNIHYQPVVFADHHRYQDQELRQILNQYGAIITTAKDAVKIRAVWHNQPQLLSQVWVLPVEAVLSAQCWQILQQQLADVRININGININSSHQ